MISRKGVDHLLTAFGKLPEHTRLLLVGREAELPGLLPRLPLKVRERITYAGFQPPDALPGFFARADVFVLPSRYDGWGVVVNQALGAGLPILLSDQVGAAYDLLAAGENGDWFEADDPLELQAKMMQFAWDPELCERWGATSRERSNDWDPEDGAERWVQALRRVCGANIAA
jgi:glycosyltransferase involved in cell wall biosynthesis